MADVSWRNSLLDELDALLPDSSAPTGARAAAEGVSPPASGPAAVGVAPGPPSPQGSHVEEVQASKAVLITEATQCLGGMEVADKATVSIHHTASLKGLHGSAIALPPRPSEDGKTHVADSTGAVASNKDTQYQPSFAPTPPSPRLAGPSSPAAEQPAQGQHEHDPGQPRNKMPPQCKQPMPVFSFQDIMQGRPSSSGRMPSHGRPPLPRMPGGPASGMHPQACAACERKEQQIADLSAQLLKASDEVASTRRELIDLDGHCEALEQLVGDREGQVLEIEGIAADQAASLGKLQAEQEAAEASHGSAVAQLRQEVARLEVQLQSAADREAAAAAAGAAAENASAELMAELHAQVNRKKKKYCRAVLGLL